MKIIKTLVNHPIGSAVIATLIAASIVAVFPSSNDNAKQASSAANNGMQPKPQLEAQQNPNSNDQEERLVGFNKEHIENNAKSIRKIIKSAESNFENLDDIYFAFDSNALNVGVDTSNVTIVNGKELSENRRTLLCSGAPPYSAELHIHFFTGSEAEVSKGYRELVVAIQSVIANNPIWTYSNREDVSINAVNKNIRIRVYKIESPAHDGKFHLSMHVNTRGKGINGGCVDTDN